MSAAIMSAKSPIDLLAFAPVAIGFTPSESIVMLTFGGSAFHARIDLPTTDEARAGTTDALLAPAKKHHVERVIFIFYTEEPSSVADAAWLSLRFNFMEAGIDIIDALLVQGGRYVSLFNASVNGDADVSAHPFTVQVAVERGQVVRPSREALRELIAPRDVLDDSWLPAPMPLAESEIEDVIADASAERKFSSAQLGTVLVSLPTGRLRDVITGIIAKRENTDHHVDLWIDATARAPQQYRAHAASILALAAYMSGDGALAWIAIDAALEANPNNTLAGLIKSAVEGAMDPSIMAGAFHS